MFQIMEVGYIVMALLWKFGFSEVVGATFVGCRNKGSCIYANDKLKNTCVLKFFHLVSLTVHFTKLVTIYQLKYCLNYCN